MAGDTTSIRLPAGFLEAGKLYVVTVAAIGAEAYDVKSKPFTADTVLQLSTAETVTGVLTIQ